MDFATAVTLPVRGLVLVEDEVGADGDFFVREALAARQGAGGALYVPPPHGSWARDGVVVTHCATPAAVLAAISAASPAVVALSGLDDVWGGEGDEDARDEALAAAVDAAVSSGALVVARTHGDSGSALTGMLTHVAACRVRIDALRGGHAKDVHCVCEVEWSAARAPRRFNVKLSEGLGATFTPVG